MHPKLAAAQSQVELRPWWEALGDTGRHPGQPRGDNGCLSQRDTFLSMENILCCFHLRHNSPLTQISQEGPSPALQHPDLGRCSQPHMRIFLARQNNCNYLHSLARKTTQNQPVPICLCMQGVPEAMEKRMNLLNFHSNTRELLHSWRNLPKNHPETLGRGSPCRGEAADGHGQGTAQLLHLQHCVLQEEEEPSQIGGLKAEK